MSDLVCVVSALDEEYAWVMLPHPFNKELKVTRDIFPNGVEEGSHHLFSYNGSGLGYISVSDGVVEKLSAVTLYVEGDVDLKKMIKYIKKEYKIKLKSIQEINK
jgi:hypothetical protein